MKKIFFKVTAIAMILVMALSLCSCEKENDKSSNVVTFYMMKAIDNESSQEIVLKEVNKMIEKKIGLTIDLKFIDKGNYADKINVLLSSGEEMDLFFLTDNLKYIQYIKQGSVLQLDDLLEKYGKAILEKNDSLAWDMVKYNDGIYAVKNQGTFSVAHSLVFKKDLVDKYNFDYKSVKTYDDLEEYLKIIKENEPSVYPITAGAVSALNISQRYVDFTSGIMYDDEKDKFIYTLDCDENQEKWKVSKDFYDKGYLPKDAISKTDVNSEVKLGKYAVASDAGFYTEDGSKSSAFYGFPCVETYTCNTVISSAEGGRICISSSSKHPEKAMQVLNLLWEDPEIMNTLAYGVEGVNYVVDEEKTTKIGSKSVIPKSGTEQTWAIWHNWIGPLFDQWDSPWNSLESLENMKKMNKDGKKAKCLGFNFNSDPVKSEYAQCSAIYEESKDVLKIGCMENYDEYLESIDKKYKSAGIDTVLKEINKQYKEWKKEK